MLPTFGYRGYCHDSYTGLYYLQSRYYDPNTGRFINADDTNYLNATGTVLGCNLFAYCENDPVNFVDATGTISLKRLKQVWLVKFLRALVGTSVDNDQELFSYSELGITIVISATVSKSYNPDAFFTISGNSISAQLGNHNLSLSKTKAKLSKSFSYKNVSVKSFFAISDKYVELGLALERYVDGIKNYRGYSIGLELAVRITHKALKIMVATLIAVNLIIPKLIPLFSKIATTIGALASTPSGLKAAISGVLGVVYYAYS